MKTKPLSELFNSSVKDFSIYNCERAIPSAVDGFKPSQRKVIFGMLKEFPTQEIKVSLAASAIQSCSSYHHGSIEGVMINMAQSFPGANNAPYLEPIGQFGSRISPESAATRYIFTKLSPQFKKLFKKEDEAILESLEDDGQSIEPKYYLPILPNILINGSSGMGTGFACSILAYNPIDLKEACVLAIKNKPLKPLVPWYNGFIGDIKKEGNQVSFIGKYEIINTTTIRVYELPIGVYTIGYRATLNKLEAGGFIKSYDDNTTEDRTEFIITCPRETTKKTHEELLKLFKLIGRDTENFTAWTDEGKIRDFGSPEAIVTWFVEFRLKKYEQRRLVMIRDLEEECKLLDEKVRFIEFYLKNTVWFSSTKKKEVETRLTEEGFLNITSLMSIRLYNLTLDEIEALKKTSLDTLDQLETLKNKTASDLYLKELADLKL